jgi:hypothetical protein
MSRDAAVTDKLGLALGESRGAEGRLANRAGMQRPRFRSALTEWAWVIIVLAGFGFVAWLILAAVATAFLD